VGIRASLERHSAVARDTRRLRTQKVSSEKTRSGPATQVTVSPEGGAGAWRTDVSKDRLNETLREARTVTRGEP
jgi:hypothetical protein